MRRQLRGWGWSSSGPGGGRLDFRECWRLSTFLHRDAPSVSECGQHSPAGGLFFFLDLANPETTLALAYGAKDVTNLQQIRTAERPDYRPRFCTPSGKFFAPFRIACVSVAVFFSLASCRIEEKSVGCLRLSVAERFAGLVCLVSLGTVHRISRSPLSCSHLRGFPIGATHLCFLLRTSIQSR